MHSLLNLLSFQLSLKNYINNSEVGAIYWKILPTYIDNPGREGKGFDLNADLMDSFSTQRAVWPCITLPP